MSVYKRGGKYWFKFTLRGLLVRESAGTANRELAVKAERERRRALEQGIAGVKAGAKPLVFERVAGEWLKLNRARWSTSNYRIETYNLRHLLPHFGKKLLTDITADDISRYQAARQAEGAGPRTINLEVGTLRSIMRKHRLWANIQPDVRPLRTRDNVGKALTPDEQHRLLIACKNSRSRSLYPAALVSLHTGLRSAELRSLRWSNIDLLGRTITVGKSKTKGGEGRLVPMSETCFQTIVEWRGQFPDAKPADYVFPSEKYGLAGESGHTAGKVIPYDINPERPISSWKVAWERARKVAGVSCRWHDMRHTFISRLSETQASDVEIMSLAGHVSRKMMEHYSHARQERKRAAIAKAFDGPMEM